MLDQLSNTSPVVRQQLPSTVAPQHETLSMPYWQSEKRMSRGCARSAAPM